MDFLLLPPRVRYGRACVEAGHKEELQDEAAARALRELRYGIEAGGAIRDWAARDPSLRWLRKKDPMGVARVAGKGSGIERAVVLAVEQVPGEPSTRFVTIDVGRRPSRAPLEPNIACVELGFSAEGGRPATWETWKPIHFWKAEVVPGGPGAPYAKQRYRGHVLFPKDGTYELMGRVRASDAMSWVYVDRQGYVLGDATSSGVNRPWVVVVKTPTAADSGQTTDRESDPAASAQEAGIGMPEDVSLPLFVYGALKPGEVAHRLVLPHLSESPVNAIAPGELRLRDGLSLLVPEGSGRVRGQLLRFIDVRSGYTAVASYEPKHQYRWTVIALASPPERANVLVGRRPNVGTAEIEAGEWRSADDPAFREALEVVQSIRSSNADDTGWQPFFRDQAAYLLLWASVERYAALAYGPALNPEEKVRRLESDDAFVALLRAAAVGRNLPARVIDSRDPETAYAFQSRPLAYLRQVRNNLSHRGKSAWRERDLVRSSLDVLHAGFGRLLERRVFGADDASP